MLRTGIAVFALPLSVLIIPVTTSRHDKVMDVLHFLLPLQVLCGGLILLGPYLIIGALVRIRQQDRMVLTRKKKNSQISEFFD